ncbi:hypothetical protein IKE71_00690 [Candidatus Saccharibacteria bacterium]|nr:hypothetical protein [Candidatus Saccharibacteria bacterium]
MKDEKDDIILPEATTFERVEPKVEKKSSKKPLILILFTLGLIVLASALTVVVLNAKSSQDSAIKPAQSSVLKYDHDEVQSALTRASERLEVGDYIAARTILESYSAIERMTMPVRFRYFDLMRQLYSESNPTLASKYAELAEEAKAAILKGDDL